MKAVRVRQFGEPDVLQLVEIPDLAPGPGQILIRVRAAGVNPVDTYIRSGNYEKLPTTPYTPGSDGAGEVSAIGANITGLSPGNRVYIAGSLTGTYAEQALCLPAHVHPLPDSFTYAQGAALGVPYATAYIALFHRAKAQAGETILIHGATGGTGLAAVQLALDAGLQVLATAGTAEGRALLEREEIHGVFDHHSTGHFQEILEATNGRGVDVILESLANVNLGKDLPLLAHFGRVIVLGCRGLVTIQPRDIMVRNADIRGVKLSAVPQDILAATHRALAKGLQKGALRPIIRHSYPLADASKAHVQVANTGALGKIVLLP